MPETQDTSNGEAAEPTRVSLEDVSAFIRQLNHDLRNHLNAAELQSAFIAEVTEEAEVKDELKRLRGMLSEMGTALQKVSVALAPVRLTRMPYEADALMADLRQRVEGEMPEAREAIDWKVDCGAALLEIDPQQLLPALTELFANAFRHQRGTGPIQARAEIEGGRFRFSLVEPKQNFSASMADWGKRPFANLKHGHYSLGLPRVRGIVKAHDGEFDARYDAAGAVLVTTITLPAQSAA